MYQALIIGHTLIALGIVTLVLLQHGRGADAGAAFGSGASGTVFGAQGSSSFLTRTTGIFAALFFVTSLGLAILGDTRISDEGFMDIPDSEAVPTDLPPGQVELIQDPVSDFPDLPVPEEMPVILEEDLDISDLPVGSAGNPSAAE